VTAIFALDDLPEKWHAYIEINKNYVTAVSFQSTISKSERSTTTNSHSRTDHPASAGTAPSLHRLRPIRRQLKDLAHTCTYEYDAEVIHETSRGRMYEKLDATGAVFLPADVARS